MFERTQHYKIKKRRHRYGFKGMVTRISDIKGVRDLFPNVLKFMLGYSVYLTRYVFLSSMQTNGSEHR